MAGRKRLESAIFSSFRVQLNLRATDMDVALNSDIKRLIGLAESKRADGSMPQFIIRALLNQMLMDERGVNPGEHVVPSSQVVPIDRAITVSTHQPTVGTSQSLVIDDVHGGQGARDKDFAGQQGSSSISLVGPAQIIANTLKALEEGEGEFLPPPKRRMGKSAMNAMG